jgi:hypothetical protein
MSCNGGCACLAVLLAAGAITFGVESAAGPWATIPAFDPSRRVNSSADGAAIFTYSVSDRAAPDQTPALPHVETANGSRSQPFDAARKLPNESAPGPLSPVSPLTKFHG